MSIQLASLMILFCCLLIEQKEELCAVEQQLKKAEAAQRRKMQVEKAARESEVWPFSLLMSSICNAGELFGMYLSNSFKTCYQIIG